MTEQKVIQISLPLFNYFSQNHVLVTFIREIRSATQQLVDKNYYLKITSQLQFWTPKMASTLM